jgi:hypothetical protein
MEPAPRPDLSAQQRAFPARGAERAAVDVVAIRTALDAAVTQRRGPTTDRTEAGGQLARALRSALAEGVAERNGPTP